MTTRILILALTLAILTTLAPFVGITGTGEIQAVAIVVAVIAYTGLVLGRLEGKSTKS